jgi:GNAT superfamily N-acetyltransferase
VITRASADEVIDLRWRVLHPGRARRDAHMASDHAPSTRHWALRRHGVVVAVVSVLELRGLALRGMAVEPSLQRLGLGARLLDHVQREVDAAMWCNARSSAVAFYSACGWTPVGPAFEIDGEGPHQRMVWAPGNAS